VRARELWKIPEADLAEAQNRRDAGRRSRHKKTRGSTSSPTARSGAKATRTRLLRRSMASIWKIPAPLWTQRTPEPGAAWWGRSAGAIRWVFPTRFLMWPHQAPVKVTVARPFTMAQQAQSNFYAGSRQLAADGLRDCGQRGDPRPVRRGADIVQIDEPYIQARPAEARFLRLQASNRPCRWISGQTAVHIAFGYAAIIHERPSRYSFLSELADCLVSEVRSRRPIESRWRAVCTRSGERNRSWGDRLSNEQIENARSRSRRDPRAAASRLR